MCSSIMLVTLLDYLVGACDGDPHISTVDGHKYTFNGLGEYWLIQTTNGQFSLQARTAKVWDVNDVEKDASVLSAFAAKDNGGDRVQVELDTTRTGISHQQHHTC